MERRAFLRTAIGIGLAGGVGLLVFQDQPAEGNCPKAIACGDCEAFGNCELPRAKETKPLPSRFSVVGVERSVKPS